jgi:hypothetical protein
VPCESRAKLLEHRVVCLGLDDDRRVLVVLRGRADHRRAADVDVLDDLGVLHPAPRRRALERVEVHAHEVDELDLVLCGCSHVVRVAADGEDARVELRMQRLDAAVHDLREAGEVVDRADVQTGVRQLGRGAAGGDDLDAELGETLGEVDDAALVGDREQCPADPDVLRLGDVGRPRDWPSIVKAAAGKTRPMTEQGSDPGEQIQHRADNLEEDLGRLEERIDDAKDRLKERQEDAEGTGAAEAVAGDWEEAAPDRPLGDDAEGAGSES